MVVVVGNSHEQQHDQFVQKPAADWLWHTTRWTKPGVREEYFFFFVPTAGQETSNLNIFRSVIQKLGTQRKLSHTHTHNSGCISHHTPTWFVVLLRYCMKVNQNGRAFYEIKYSMGPTPKNNFFSFFVVVYTCRVLCSIYYLYVWEFWWAAMLPNRMISGEAERENLEGNRFRQPNWKLSL